MAAIKFYLHGGRFGFFFSDLSKGEFLYEEIHVPPSPPPPSAGQPPAHHFSLASTSLIATASLLSFCALLLAVCLIFTYRLRNRTSENDSSSNWLPEWLRRRLQQRSRSSSTRGLEGGILGGQDQGDDFLMHINHVWYVRTAGLDRSLIDSIATFKFIKIQQDKAVDQDDDSDSDGGVMTNCAVCLSEFQEGEELRLLPKCSHAFHRDCIYMWLSSHINCPLCRTPVIIAAVVDNTSAAVPIASPPPPPSAFSSSSTSLPSSSISADGDAAIVVDEKDLMGAGGKLKSIRRSASMDDCSSPTTRTRGVLFRLQSGRQHKRPLRSKSSSYCGGQLWKEELNESTN